MKMRFALSIVMLGSLVIAIGGQFVAPRAAAQDASVSVWVEFATVEPGVGCSVDVSADGGNGLAGAEIALVVSDDATGAVISSDSSTANGSGIAWLTIDTSSASVEAKAWASISVNGHYLGGKTIRVSSGGSCSGSPVLVTVNGAVSLSSGVSSASDDSSAANTSSSDTGAVIPGAFGYQQQRGLSCEYAALAIATSMLGNGISEYDFEALTPLNANPHWGYRGDITGSWGNTTDYGVYAGPLATTLQQFGFAGDVFYGGRSNLTSQIDLGRPTLVWIGARGETGSFYEWTADGSRYQLTPYMHVVVVYGYDDWGVYISDPGNETLSHWDWASFEGMWNVMDGMALAVHW